MGLVGERDDGVRVGVVDMFERQIGVQNGLDRGRRRGGVEQQAPLLCDHFLVAERVEARERLQWRELHRRQPRRLYRAHVPAAAFHAQDIDLRPVEVSPLRLDRRIPAPVQHEARNLTEQARRIDPDRQIFGISGAGVFRDRGSGFGVVPTRLHATFPLSPLKIRPALRRPTAPLARGLPAQTRLWSDVQSRQAFFIDGAICFRL